MVHRTLERNRLGAAVRAFDWVRPMAAQNRVLVILVENGGVDLGIPTLVEKLLQMLPGSSVIPESFRQALVDTLRSKIKAITDNLLESAELAVNRYQDAKPSLFSDVIVLRDGTSSYQDLKRTLIDQSREGKIIDLFILTHGGRDYISVPGGVDGEKIKAMRAEYGKPLSIRSVYMMNCVGGSLNQAWIEAGARVSSGSRGNNYLPEPTMFFFWKNWKAGQGFAQASSGAYGKTVALLNTLVKNAISNLGWMVSSLVPDIDVETLDFVQVSAPVILGQRNLTINSDELNFSQSLTSSLATTVLPLGVLQSLSEGVGVPSPSPSSQAIDFIKKWEGFRAKPYNDPVGHCTVGYGTLLHRGNCDGRSEETPYSGGVSEAEASRLLSQEVARAQKTVSECVTVTLNQNQTDSLVSFVYNLGGDRLRQSTLLKLLNQGNYSAVPGEFRKWTKARQQGVLVDLPGLVKRRQAEADLFAKPVAGVSTSESLSRQSRFLYLSPSRLAAAQSAYSYAQNPIMVAGVELADAIQIGLAGAAMVQSGVSASQGSFTLSYDKWQRLLTPEARSQMPGAQGAKQRYSRRLFWIAAGRVNTATADVIIEWEGNAYGEIGTPVIRRDLQNSTEWSKSAANLTISKLDRIPAPGTDPRAWPIVYSYEGTFDPWGNGYFEFSGEFEIDAFGGLRFNRHEVVSRAALDLMVFGSPQEYVRKGDDASVAVPPIPKEQSDYLKNKPSW